MPDTQQPSSTPHGHNIEPVVDPHTVYVADDPVRPRWRFSFVIRNDGHREMEVGECRIQHRTGSTSPWVTAQALTLSSTANPERAGPDITVGPSRIGPAGMTGLDLRDCVPGDLPSEIRIEADVRADGDPRTATVSRVVPLIPQRTRYVTFPLEGEWVAANGRADLHGIGRTFAFDFVTEADWHRQRTRRGEECRPDELDSFDRPLRSPVDGRIVACESAMPDLVCTPGASTYAKGPPAGLPALAILGNWVLIETAARDYMWLVHLKQGSVLVQPAMQVEAGQLIGRVGNSGNTSGAHLHIEMLDGLPEFEKRFTGDFRQSGLPFGFRDVEVKNGTGRRCGDLVPEKGDIVAASGRAEGGV